MADGKILKLRLKQGTTNPVSELNYTDDKYDITHAGGLFYVTPKGRPVKTFIVPLGVVEFFIHANARTWAEMDGPVTTVTLVKRGPGRPPKQHDIG